jgi:hypothetical protein
MKKWKTCALIIFTTVLTLIGVGYYSGFFFLNGITPCLPPPKIMVDGAAVAKIYTWVDEDMDGEIDNSEKPLPHVKIAYPSSEFDSINGGFTSNYGMASTFDFKPGCVCDCWKFSYVEVISPDGFHPTTPLRQELTGDNLRYEFGFVEIIPEN